MFTIASAIIAAVFSFGSIEGNAVPDTTPVVAPMTWEDAPEAMLEAGYSLPGDDNLDGIIDEDESGWNCATMGNKICGPDKSIDEHHDISACQAWDYTWDGTFFTYGERNYSVPLCYDSVQGHQ